MLYQLTYGATSMCVQFTFEDCRLSEISDYVSMSLCTSVGEFEPRRSHGFFTFLHFVKFAKQDFGEVYFAHGLSWSRPYKSSTVFDLS